LRRKTGTIAMQNNLTRFLIEFSLQNKTMYNAFFA